MYRLLFRPINVLRRLLAACCTAAVLLAPGIVAAAVGSDTPVLPQYINYTIITDVTASGQKVVAIAVEYQDNVLASEDLKKTFDVKVMLPQSAANGAGSAQAARRVTAAYTNDRPQISTAPKAGRYIIVELSADDAASQTYQLRRDNGTPLVFREYDANRSIINRERIQATTVPEFYREQMVYTVSQRGYVKLSNGTTIDKHTGTISGAVGNVINRYIDGFEQGSFAAPDNARNRLDYRFYQPAMHTGQTYPLVIFLHGSGQVGSDNIAHLVGSRGATTWLDEQPCFVLAPQCPAVFDAFDQYDLLTGTGGGIHWQSLNRRTLLLGMIDDIVARHAGIDDRRIYIQGLSRGAEGALYLLLDRPGFFAGALLMSGREAYTKEWLDGNATADKLRAIKDMPIWLFHAKEDSVSPVAGSRINFDILSNQLGSRQVRYTEFTTTGAAAAAGDNGIVNNSAHNTWDAVYNSPEVKAWLFSQVRE